jgi:hypothetical protein
MLRAGRADRNHHDAVRLHLLQKWRRDMVDGAGDDDLVLNLSSIGGAAFQS